MNTAVALPLRPSRPGALCGLISATLSAICPDKIPSWTTYIPWIVKYVSMIVFIILFNRFISLAKETHVCSVVSQPLCQYLCWDRSVLSLIASKKKKKVSLQFESVLLSGSLNNPPQFNNGTSIHLWISDRKPKNILNHARPNSWL